MCKARVGQFVLGLLGAVGVHEIIEVLPAARIDDFRQKSRVQLEPLRQLGQREVGLAPGLRLVHELQ